MPIRNICFTVFIFSVFFLPGTAQPQEGSPAGPVPTEILKLRRQLLLDALDGVPALLSSAGSRGGYAQDSDYREDNDFFYLTGIEAPGGWVLFNGGEDEEAVLYLPPRSGAAERWTGPQLGPGDRARTLTGFSEVRSTEELEVDLGRRFGGETPGTGGSGEVLLVSFGDDRFETELESILPLEKPEMGSLSRVLAPLRLVKDAEEIRRLRQAVDITSEAHREIWRFAQPGFPEYEIEAVLEYVFAAQGAERRGFPSIVGSGPNGVILHYDKNRRKTEEGELVVVDIGAEFGYYTADLTRTFPVGGSFSPRQRALYDLVLGAWQAGLEEIRPGATIREVNQAVRTFLGTNSGELCGDSSCEPFLIHGVSHWLGMDVHDVGSNSSPFVPGMVLTLEPGLYLPEEALGIRIEDDILVTDAGYELLSADLPRSAGEIEAIMLQEPKWVRRTPSDPETMREFHEKETGS